MTSPDDTFPTSYGSPDEPVTDTAPDAGSSPLGEAEQVSGGRPSDDGAPGDLAGRLFRLDMLLRRHHFVSRGRGGPRRRAERGQGRVLAALRLRSPISQRDLAYLLDLRPQSLGELLAKLETDGLVARVPSADDRRTHQVELTSEGTSAAEQLDSERPDEQDPFGVLSDEERATLATLLDRVIADLDARLGAEDPRRGGRRGRGFGPGFDPEGPGFGPGGPGFGPGPDSRAPGFEARDYDRPERGGRGHGGHGRGGHGPRER